MGAVESGRTAMGTFWRNCEMPFTLDKLAGEFEQTREMIKSVSEFLECAKWKWEEWMKVVHWKPQEKAPWFRGVASENYKLVPSIYRGKGEDGIGWDYRADEAVDMQAEFARRARPFLRDTNSYSDGEYLHLMQHYGLPTRLLDWTEGALIALYFAIRIPKKEPRVPCVWMLNPSWLNFVNDATKENNTTEESKSLVLYTERTAMAKYDQDAVIREHYLNEHKLARLPVAVFPPHIDRRIVAQKSVFTLHGHEEDGFGILSKTHLDTQVCKIRIDPASRTEMTKDLNRAGVTETTIFPDLEGLAREIQAEYEMPLKSR
jgi:hypothetical protein